MNKELLQGFYLGDLFIEPLKGQVTGRGASSHLTPKATEVLLVLASRPGSLVTRDDLLKKVWGVGQGSPEALSHAVSEIRHALGDSAVDPTFIQTLPRRGYRLIPEPEPADAHTASVVIGGGAAARDFSFLDSLMQRGVVEAGLAYLVLGWLLIQIGDVVFDQLLLPQWAGTFVTILVIAGFPIALVLSWFLEFRDGKAVVDRGISRHDARRRFSRTYLSVIGALALASVLVYAYDRFIGLPQAAVVDAVPIAAEPEPPPIESNTIAVLPFLNVDGGEQTDIFASGFAEDMINRLAIIPGLSVSSRGDAWSLGPSASSADVRRRLRVAHYVEGSVQIGRERIGVNVKLIDSATGFPVISRNFEVPLEDFNQVRRDITRLTVANLRIALPPETVSALDTLYEEEDVDAYILYRRGKEAFEQPHTLATLEQAVSFYQTALELDPRYAAAHAGLCNAYVSIHGVTGAEQDIDQAQRACASALESNPRLPMVYNALGTLYLGTGRLAEAERAFEEALSLNPQEVPAMGGLADVYRRTQRLEEAEELLRAAVRSQPGNWRALNRLGRFLFTLGRFQEAAAQYRQIVFMDPENFQARGNLGSALLMAGDFEPGRRVLEEALELHPTQRTYSNLGVVYYLTGEFEKSVEVHRQAVDMASGRALPWLNLADALHFAGRADEAAEAYGRARDLAQRDLRVDPSDSVSTFTLAWAQHMLGDSRQALEGVERGLALDPGDPYGYYYDALIRYRTGNERIALESLRTALEKGYPPGLLVAEPHLGDLRTDGRFHRIITDSL